MKKLLVVGDSGDTREYLIPRASTCTFRGDHVKAGDRLTEDQLAHTIS
jgi:hypothetical protein